MTASKKSACLELPRTKGFKYLGACVGSPDVGDFYLEGRAEAGADNSSLPPAEVLRALITLLNALVAHVMLLYRSWELHFPLSCGIQRSYEVCSK